MMDTKQTLRRTLIKHRNDISTDEIARLSTAISTHLESAYPHLAQMHVGFFLPIKNEPDLRPLMKKWMRANHPQFKALLPVIQANDAPLVFRHFGSQSRLITGAYGIPIPEEGAYFTPQTILIPGVAFDDAGYRLGYGGGFFDRTLAALHPRPLCLGIGFDAGRLATMSPESHDRPMDALVTESGVFLPPIF